MRATKFTLSIIFFFLFTVSGKSQSDSNSDFFHQKRFNAGFVAGFNASELSGNDGFGSYIGANLGIFGIVDLNKKMHLSMELLWSQNGEYIHPESFTNLDDAQIKLNFIEIPFQLNYQLRQNGLENRRFGWLRAGLAYTYLLDYSIFKKNIDVTNQVVFAKKNAIIVNFGGAFFLNQHLGIDVRMSLPTQIGDLIPTFSFRGIYLL